jgi:uncharacterized protein (TIGR02001 family)
MTPFKGFVATGLLLGSAAAHAQLSSTWTAASEYDFRGFSQSAKDPALQGSVDYAFSQGFTVGAWASNIDFDPADNDIELDLYGGYTGTINDTFAWTAGVTYYAYPGSGDLEDYAEIYLGLNAGPVQFKQWYANDLYGLDDSAYYTEANASFPLPANFSVLLHAGYSWGDYWQDQFGTEVFDYSLGVGYALGNFNLALKWTATDDESIETDVGNNEGRVIFTVATTFPWKD